MKILKRGLTAPQVLVLGFGALILVGSLLLMLPISTFSGHIRFLDALFTATSAVCVTGLNVVDTHDTFTVFGRTVIMLLIQIGGLGVATASAFSALLLGKKIGLRERILLQEALNQSHLQGLVRLTRYVIAVTLTIELIAAALLTVGWVRELGPFRAVGYGIFHAVSAFNNAGFDLWGSFQSLSGQGVWPVAIIATLIVLGGLGFGTISDIQEARKWHELSLHSQIVLTTTAALIVGGAVALFITEFGGALWGQAPLSVQWGQALFQSITARTAGFATLNLDGLRPASLLIMIALMFIGASPGSTGGGIKTTTFATLLLAVRAAVSRRPQPITFSHRIPADTVVRALTVAFLAATLVLVVSILLAATNPTIPLENLMFEAVSAFATVGLTTGITPHLSDPGRLLLIMTMFAGRVGLVTFVMAIARPHQDHFRYPEDKIQIG